MVHAANWLGCFTVCMLQVISGVGMPQGVYLVMYIQRPGRKCDGPWTTRCGASFQEDHGLCRHIIAKLLCVLSVVPANAPDVGWGKEVLGSSCCGESCEPNGCAYNYQTFVSKANVCLIW